MNLTKKVAICAILSVASLVGHAQTISMVFSVGVMSTSNGAAVNDGSLVQIIASSDSTFAAPTATGFVGGNDVLIFSGGVDSISAGLNGATVVNLTNLSLSTYPVAGYFLLARWFPSLTTLSSAPGNSTAYGQFGYTNDTSWVAPATGNAQSYEFLTVSAGGALADSVGSATLATPAAVPEPATYAAIFGALAIGLVAYRRRAVAA